ncbi:MAG: glycosyltransferase family 2 protein [Ruminococcus sp.]|nr:glycosyltransferase family 2 protein [Ruminococcus sp.]
MGSPEILYMVVPCYDEQDVLRETAGQLKNKYSTLISQGLISEKSRILFVNDGSADGTWEIIRSLHEAEPELFSGLSLARNSGHQNAVLAGLMTVKDICDMCITMDADLQDDINAVDEMVKKYYEGNQVVYGVRSQRKTDSFFKRSTAQFFYKFMSFMGAEVVYNHADFRLMSRRVLNELAGFREVNLFLRGMVPLIGFKSCSVYYERHERIAGKSKYPLGKMLSFAVNGITSFSTKPLKLITTLGFVMSLASIFAFIWAFIAKIGGFSEHGWSSTMCSIWLIGGLQLFCLGIIGEYIGKIYAEVKQRPRYIVEEFLSDTNKKEENNDLQ